MSEHRFQGKLEESHGDYGRVCNLLLVDGHFVLDYVVYAPHHIEDGELFRGTYTAAGHEVRMEAVEHTSYHEETERQEKTRSGKWQLTLHAVKEGDPGPLSGGAGPFELVLEVPPRKKGGVGSKRYTELRPADEVRK